ncbi:MAG: flagellar biosynthetic protein FliO [Mesorhizobium sp.]
MAFWAIAACIVLVALYLIYLLIKRFRSGTYVAGGRNRKARLAIMDATAVDTHRRLVLVRRDDVEHLLLIGGHSDIVVESDIRVHGAAKRPTMVTETTHGVEPPVVQPRPQNVRAEPVHAPAQHQPAPHREPAAPARPVAPRQTVHIQPRPAVVPPPARSADELDSDLLKELETALDSEDVPAAAAEQGQIIS